MTAAPPASSPLLILVHPGSACGSANFNLGHAMAQGAREKLIAELDAWQGGLVVIDGTLSDELPAYRRFAEAIDQALTRAKATGEIATRVFGCDMEVVHTQQRAAIEVVRAHQIGPDHEIHLTGCWFDPDGDSGCVNSVRDALAGFGYRRLTISDSAISVATEDENPEDGLPTP